MIIGLIGFKQVGKSTAAKYLEEHHGFVRINMKDALVAELKKNFPDLLALLGDRYSQTMDELFDQKPAMMRALMQNYGTEVRRGDRKHYWVEQWALRCLDAVQQGRNIVVDDVRFFNEAAAVKAQGGYMVRLTRPDVIDGGSHVSELEQKMIPEHYIIPSEKGAHDKLYAELETMIADIKTH